MRRSTAAGINPCVRTPPPEYMSSGCHRMQLRGIPRLAFAVSVSAVVLYGKSPLFLVFLAHSAHSVPERASSYTEHTFGAKNRLLLYATHF